MNKNIQLTPATLNWLGLAFENKTRVSPLSSAPNDRLTQTGLDSLIEQGVVTADKVMTTQAYALMDILAGATMFASLKLSGGSGHINRITYWKGDKSVSLNNSGGTFILSPGNNVEALEVTLQEITGSNRLISSNFTASFDLRSAVVFSALFDLSRKAAIRLYADGSDVPDGFSPEEISKFIKESDNSRWITSHIKTLTVTGITVTAKQALTSLESLSEAGVIGSVKGGLYTLAYASAQLAANFLFIENTVHFRSGKENKDGNIAFTEGMFVQAGIHDVIMIDISEGKVEISAVSSYAMTEDIKTMMTIPPDF
ncbi:MAG: hypothetical protein PHE15_04590 [Dehalococcoidales bacterium]|nr:hypothetical protein [Dehalococcoidales bacterium]